MLSLVLVGFLTLLAQETPPPTINGLWGLGVIAVALVVGAAITYRYVALPERTRADKAEAARDASFAREREGYQSVTPVMVAVTDVMGRVLAVLGAPEKTK